MNSSPPPHRSVGGPAGPARRLGWVDVTKGLAMAGVVAYHAALFLEPVGLASAWQADATRVLAISVCLPAFFLASGLFGQRLLTDGWSILFHRRIALLLYLYVAWSLVRFVVFQVVPWVLPSSDPSDWREPVSMFLRPNGGLWFLYALVLYSVLVRLTRALPSAAVVGASAVVSAAFTTELLSTGNTGWDKTGANIVFFVAAVHYGRPLLRAVPRVPVPVVAAVVLVTAFAGAGLALGLLPAGRLVKLGLAPLSVVALTTLSVALTRSAASDVLVHFGQLTLPVYLVHYLPIAATCGLLSTSPGLADALRPATAVLPLLLTVLATAFSLGMWRVLRRTPGVFRLPRRTPQTPSAAPGRPVSAAADEA